MLANLSSGNRVRASNIESDQSVANEHDKMIFDASITLFLS